MEHEWFISNKPGYRTQLILNTCLEHAVTSLTREEIAKWNQMTALRFQTGGKHPTSPASLGGGGRGEGHTSTATCPNVNTRENSGFRAENHPKSYSQSECHEVFLAESLKSGRQFWPTGQSIATEQRTSGYLVSCCLERSQPQRITSELYTNFPPPPSYSFHKSSYHKSGFFRLFYIPRALSTGTSIRQGDLLYSAGLHRNHVLATANTGKIGRGFRNNSGEWTGRVEISKEEILGSKRSMYGYILIYSKL